MSLYEAVAGHGQLLGTFKLLRTEALKRDDVSMTASSGARFSSKIDYRMGKQ